jgi:hypothetical protein
MNFFERVNSLIRESEASIVNLLSSLAPWLAPLAPAYMTFSHLIRAEMGFPAYIAWAVAAVVEVLGLSAVSTILAFWSHNRRYKQDYKKAPVWMAVMAFSVYLGIVLTINVVIDASGIRGSGMNAEWVNVFAKALLTLLSVPAAVILAVRTQHKEMLDTIEHERQDRKTARSPHHAAQVSSTGHRSEEDDGVLSDNRKKKFFQDISSGKLQEQLTESSLEFTADNISTLYHVSWRTAMRWMAQLKKNGHNN